MTRITNAGGIDEWGGMCRMARGSFFSSVTAATGSDANLGEGGNAEKMPAPFENTRLFASRPTIHSF